MTALKFYYRKKIARTVTRYNVDGATSMTPHKCNDYACTEFRDGLGALLEGRL